jgi:hypothetical protein
MPGPIGWSNTIGGIDGERSPAGASVAAEIAESCAAPLRVDVVDVGVADGSVRAEPDRTIAYDTVGTTTPAVATRKRRRVYTAGSCRAPADGLMGLR